jgi:voltage-gated potassium channel
MSLKSRIHGVLALPDPHHGAGRIVNLAMGGLILANVAAAVAESIPSVHSDADWSRALHAFDAVSVAIFTVEYLLRLWSCTQEPAYSHPLWGRLRWMFSPMAIIDLLAFAPFYVALVVRHEAVDLRVVRLLRLVRILRLLKLTRHSEALQTLWRVVYSKRHDLANSLMLLSLLVVLFASLAYVFEHGADPEKPDHFSSIPAAMWWAVVTLTTVGYGDVFPITVGGRIVAACTAACGIAMFALPTAVLGAAFMNELSERESTARSAGEAAAAGTPSTDPPARPASATCPHCGKELSGPPAG